MSTDALQVALAAASADLATDANGGLRFSFRERIWSTFGPYLENTTVQDLGLLRRTRLAVLCVRRVLPMWERKWPSDNIPHRMLETAEGYCRQQVEKKVARRLRDTGWTHADDLSAECYDADDTTGRSAAFVCYAACQALYVALFDEPFGPDFNRATIYGEGDPEVLDAAYLVSYVEAGGWPHRGEGSAAKRRSYWEWYLGGPVAAAAAASL